jgi:hypothetical protein
MKSDLNAIILTIITTLISLISLYAPEYRLLIISSTIVTFVSYILFIYVTKIEEQDKKIEELRKILKRNEDLIMIRADIESLKRGLTK